MSASEDRDAGLKPLVVHVIYALGTGGMENGLVNLINHMPRDRYRHAIVCLTTSSSFASRINSKDVPVYELHKPPGNSPRTLFALFKLFRRLQPAVVHTRNTAALECQVLGYLMPRVARVHGEHGRDIADLHGNNKRYKWLRRLLSPCITRFICVSRDLQQWLLDDVGIAEKKVVQVYNGVDRLARAPELKPPSDLPADYLPTRGRLIVGTVGRLVEVKDQRTLLCAIQHIIDKNPALAERLRVIVVGDGPLRADLERQAAPLGGIVCFSGESNNVRSYMTAMDLFVLPSLGEGISNTILEAMSSGCAVVASDVGGNPELVIEGETGRLFPVGNREALAACLTELLDNEEVRRSFGKAGKRLVEERHSWDAMVNGYLSVYDQCLAR